MNFEFYMHPDQWYLLPALIVERGECGCQDCEVSHFRLRVAFVGFSAGIVFSIPKPK